MAEYINREAAVKAFNNFDAGRAASTHSTLLTPEEFAEYLYELPAADVMPVVHGRWIEHKKYIFGTMYDCSICGTRILNNGHTWNYCPNCGAKMDGGDGDAPD
jgi:hypothetical protein